MIDKIKSYIQESYQEFLRVNWPTRKETIRLTLIVIAFSIGIALFLGILDFGFTYLLNRFLYNLKFKLLWNKAQEEIKSKQSSKSAQKDLKKRGKALVCGSYLFRLRRCGRPLFAPKS